MVEKRTLTVSVTINLGNEENLKLEVTDSADTVEEAIELKKFLADVLDDYGTNDATTRSIIESYKNRILTEKASESIQEIPIPAIPSIDEEPSFEPLTKSSEFPEIPTIMDFCEKRKTEVDSMEFFEPVESPFSTPQPAAVPIHEPEEVSATYLCSKCGAPVNKAQYEFSMLFNHKILCNNCMKR